MECNFVVGQKVVCVKEGRWTWEMEYPSDTFPRKGQILTIRSIECNDKGAYLRFGEIVNKPIYLQIDDRYSERQFFSCRFRPLATRPTDISVFTELLNTPRKPIPDTHERSPDPVEVPLC